MKGDCVVRALANVKGWDYALAYNYVFMLGRCGGGRFRFEWVVSELGGFSEVKEFEGKCWGEVESRLEVCSGRYVVMTEGHVFCVIDGVKHDVEFVGLSDKVEKVFVLLDEISVDILSDVSNSVDVGLIKKG